MKQNLKLAIASLCLLLIGACSGLQSVGILNDRAGDYKKAKVYNSNLQNSLWGFSDSYPIAKIPAQKNYPTQLTRPRLSFIQNTTHNTSYNLYLNQKTQILSGHTVAGDDAILIKTNNSNTQQLISQTISKQASQQIQPNVWLTADSATQIELSIRANFWLIVIKDNPSKLTNEQAKNTFGLAKKNNPSIKNLITILHNNLNQQLAVQITVAATK